MTTPELQTDTWVPALTFGAKLALIRHHQGWNIKEAALACDISPQSWRGWELEGRLPHDQVGTAKKIATRTNVDLLWLLYGEQLAAENLAPAAARSTRDDPKRVNPAYSNGAGRPRSYTRLHEAGVSQSLGGPVHSAHRYAEVNENSLNLSDDHRTLPGQTRRPEWICSGVTA